MSPEAQLLLEEHRGVSGVGGALVQSSSSSVYSREPLIPFSLPLSPPPLGPQEHLTSFLVLPLVSYGSDLRLSAATLSA